MTIAEARKVLGKEAESHTDNEILVDIETAEMLENLFFNIIATKTSKTPEMAS